MGWLVATVPYVYPSTEITAAASSVFRSNAMRMPFEGTGAVESWLHAVSSVASATIPNGIRRIALPLEEVRSQPDRRVDVRLRLARTACFFQRETERVV